MSCPCTGTCITQKTQGITPVRAAVTLLRPSGSLKPCTVEHLRRDMRALLNVAVRKGLLPKDQNPAAEAPAIEVPERPIMTLAVDEVVPMLDACPAQWRNLV